MEYNDSPLTKEEWDEAQALCEDNVILEKVWKVFKKLHTGQSKVAIETYNKLIKYCEISVDVITMGNGGEEEGEDELPIGFGENMEAQMLTSVRTMLKDKDDKTPERIKQIMEGYPKYIKERDSLVSQLSADDEEEFQKKKTRLEEISGQYKGKKE